MISTLMIAAISAVAFSAPVGFACFKFADRRATKRTEIEAGEILLSLLESERGMVPMECLTIHQLPSGVYWPVGVPTRDGDTCLHYFTCRDGIQRNFRLDKPVREAFSVDDAGNIGWIHGDKLLAPPPPGKKAGATRTEPRLKTSTEPASPVIPRRQIPSAALVSDPPPAPAQPPADSSAMPRLVIGEDDIPPMSAVRALQQR